MPDQVPSNLPVPTPSSITDIMQTAYIDYSMSVIISRALPDARDGFKPVQRRILYAMLREGLLHNRPFDKCAGVVGEVLKNYHPHGDSSVYDTLVRMAQDWVMRYPLIEPQGNFGSVDGDPPAAYRYTECRLRQIASDILKDIDEDTVDFIPNYKESTTEPAVLPAGLPNLLMNGSTGIAVGMTTNIPPHNLGELIDVTCALIDDPQLSIDRIMEMMPGPDFPTGGTIVGLEGIRSYMTTGRGIVRMRGTVIAEDMGNGRERLIVSTIPYNVNRANLVSRIAELVHEKVLTGVSDVRDESDERTRVVIELKKGEAARVTINKLFRHTALESSFGVILLALDQKRPKQMNIREMIQCFIEHRREVIYRRTAFRLRKAEDRAHILEGFRIAQDNMDDFVKIIRESRSRDEARTTLRKKYSLSERQANAILEMRLYQLTQLERGKIEEEYGEIIKLIATLQGILGNESQLLQVIKDELLENRERYADERRCEIVPSEGEFRMEDVIPNEGCIITLTHKGFIKRTSLKSYRTQKRGGKGIIGTGSHDEDFVESLFTAKTHDYVMFFMNDGQVFVKKAYEIPEQSRTSKGRSIANLLEYPSDIGIATMICIQEFSENHSLVMATRKGIVKKTNLSKYANSVRARGVRGIELDEGDKLIGVKLTEGEDNLLLISRKGMSVRFPETNLREQGRVTRGVKGMTLKPGKDDEVVGLVREVPGQSLLIAGENGLGKRSPFDDYRLQSRGGTGVIAIRSESICGALGVTEEDEIMLLTFSGQAVRCPVKDIRLIGRATQGVRLVNLADGDRLIGIAKVVRSEEELALEEMADAAEEGEESAEAADQPIEEASTDTPAEEDPS